MQILLLNDCRELDHLFNSCLEFGSHDVFRSTSKSLDRVLQLESFDLVFVSVTEFSDAELLSCEKIREMPRHTDTFIVLACSAFREEFIQRAFNAGVDEYLTNPTTADDLGLLLSLVVRIKKASFDQTIRLAA